VRALSKQSFPTIAAFASLPDVSSLATPARNLGLATSLYDSTRVRAMTVSVEKVPEKVLGA